MATRPPPSSCRSLVIVLLLAFPLATTGFYLEFTTKVMILAIFALSLELLVGATGLVSLGHAAFYGIAAYATVLLSPKYRRGQRVLAASGGDRVFGAVCAAVGALSLRTKGVYFIMVTLAFAQMAYYVFHDTKLGGGTDGIYLNVKPEVALFGLKLFDLGKPVVLYYVVLACLVLVFVFLAVLLQEPLRPRAGRHQEQRTADACRWVRDVSLQADGIHAGRRARGTRRFPGGGQGRLRQSGDAVLARVGCGAADADPGRHGTTVGRRARRLRVRAVAIVLPVGGGVRQFREALAADARRHDHPVRCVHAQRPHRTCRRNGVRGARARRWRRHVPDNGAPLLRARGVTRRFGGLDRGVGRVARPGRGRDPCGDRHQRRGQVDADQRACR